LSITFDTINSEPFYSDAFCDSVMVYVGNFKQAINSTIDPVSDSAKLHRDTNARRVRFFNFFFIGIVTCCTASDVTEHVLNYEFLRSVRSSWIDLCANVEVAFSDRIAGRNTREYHTEWFISRWKSWCAPPHFTAAARNADSTKFSRRNNDLLW